MRLAAKRICVIGGTEKGIRVAIALLAGGHRLTLVEEDAELLFRLARRDIPFYNPDIGKEFSKAILRRNISLNDSIKETVKGSDYIFIALGSRAGISERADIQKIKKGLEKIGSSLRKGTTVVILSRIPPGATEGLVSEILSKRSGLKPIQEFNLAVCRISQNRIVVGASRKRVGEEVASLFEGSGLKSVVTRLRAAEALEYLEGCVKATNVSRANELANLCEKLGIDARELFPLIGLEAADVGLGYGDLKLVSDVSSIIRLGDKLDERMEILRAVEKVNRRQVRRAVSLLKEELGSLKGKRIALLGLATRSGTISVEGSRAFDIAVGLLAEEARVIGYDRLAMSEFIELLPEISLASSVREALRDADGCIIQTDDIEFSRLTEQDFDLMRNKTVIDGRGILSAAKMERFGVRYRAIGLGSEKRGA